MVYSSNAQHAHMNFISGRIITIKLKAIYLNPDELKLLVEQIIDFDSFNQNRYDLWSLFIIQELDPIFQILNGPTYPHLVKNF